MPAVSSSNTSPCVLRKCSKGQKWDDYGWKKDDWETEDVTQEKEKRQPWRSIRYWQLFTICGVLAKERSIFRWRKPPSLGPISFIPGSGCQSWDKSKGGAFLLESLVSKRYTILWCRDRGGQGRVDIFPWRHHHSVAWHFWAHCYGSSRYIHMKTSSHLLFPVSIHSLSYFINAQCTMYLLLLPLSSFTWPTEVIEGPAAPDR